MTASAASLAGIRFSYDGGASWALDGVSLTIHAGEYVCLTGSNGSGKSTLARLVAGLAAPDAGDVTLLGHHVFSLSGSDGRGANPDGYRAARRSIGAVFQNPEDQLVTTITEDDVAFGPENLGLDRAEIGNRITTSLDAVGMAMHRFDDPTRMSGGQQQRVAIAGMLAMRPAMLVLDEPTAMLDPAARIEVMRILDDLHAQGTTIVHVTHHDDEVARATRTIRLEHGQIVADEAPARSPATTTDGHHAAAASAECDRSGDAPSPAAPDERPSLSCDRHDGDAARDNAIVVSHVTYRYPGADAPALDDLSLTIAAGEVVAIMGENGAGKSTLARLICALEQPQTGSITVAGIPVAASHGRRAPRPLDRKQREALRHEVGFVMQHPERQLFADTVAQDVAYGPRNQRLDEAEVAARVDEALRLLHIEDLADRSPFSLSGGQQRLAAIAGVIACRPRVLVMDEPTASLDADANARIHELIRTLKAQGVTVLVITHSLDEAHAVADRILTLGAAAGGHGSIASSVSVGSVSVGSSVSATDDHSSRADRRQQEHTDTTTSAEQKASGTSPERSSSAIAAGRNDRAHPASPGSARLVASHASAQPPRPTSLIAELDPRVKMVAFLAMMFTAFAIGTPSQLTLGAVLVAGIVAASRINPLRLLASVHMFLAMFVVMGALNIFFVRTGTVLAQLGPVPVTDDGVTIAVLYALRFALVIILGAILMETTTPTALTDGFGSLLSPLSRIGVHTQEIALVMSLALRFLPTLGTEAKAIADAQAARGGSIETGSPTARLRAMTALCVPMFAGAIRHADNLSLALDARCYEEGIHRTHWHALHIRRNDLAFAALTVIYIAALVILPLY